MLLDVVVPPLRGAEQPCALGVSGRERMTFPGDTRPAAVSVVGMERAERQREARAEGCGCRRGQT